MLVTRTCDIEVVCIIYIQEVAKLRMSNLNLNRPLHMLIVEVLE